MGVDVSHIIKHDFRRVQNRLASLSFVEKTIEGLKKNLLLPDFKYYYDEEDNETSFRLPVYDVEFFLHNGFWQIESYYHYCQIVMHSGEYFWLRRRIFDIARSLCQNEAWHATEYYTWNGGGCEYPEAVFEDWLERSIQEYGRDLPEFDQSAIMAQGDVHIPDYEPIYHDSFKECKLLFDTLQAKLGEYRLLGISRFGNGFLRCEKGGHLFLINENTLKPLFGKPIEAMDYNLNGPEFVIYKNGLSAVFDENGNQLTDFVRGRFEWKWSSCPFSRIIYNKEAGITLMPR